MKKKIPTDVNPKIGKLVAAIAEKRQELGLLEWGSLSIEEVVKCLREKPPTEELTKFTSTLLSQDQKESEKSSKRNPAAKKGNKKKGP